MDEPTTVRLLTCMSACQSFKEPFKPQYIFIVSAGNDFLSDQASAVFNGANQVVGGKWPRQQSKLEGRVGRRVCVWEGVLAV